MPTVFQRDIILVLKSSDKNNDSYIRPRIAKMKDKNEVIQEFRELVNMTAQELKDWLKGDDSNSAGWSKDDGSGESVGHDSGRRIVEILESNPDKDPEKYTDDDVSHMRKVVSYCKRHLAQEEKANNKKSIEDVKKTKSYASLKNWGHDPIKKRQANGGGAKGKPDEKEEDEEEEVEEEEDKGDDKKQDKKQDKEEKAGEKRKAKDNQSGKNKKRETEDGAADVKEDEEEDEQEEEAEEEESNDKDDNEKEKQKKNGKQSGKQNGSSSGKGDSSKGPKEGDTVSWNWGGGQPKGKVKEVNPDETTVQTKKGSNVTRKGDKEDPAVVLDTGKTDAVKLSHELNETDD
ncbi:hypothetical protein M440DRAFT_1400531 [Trichoderma longibrachiatum ATCC 18648]|uniref:Hypervirulence associated protein TUDOR domain-containing protein n=1 Tax=Trichoderma longibrachiatum ATCC 18648 TaxID=983965 RepID=A0A2T4C7Q4_TRILO|nr:hypothetical protein M440DRAFT_1400531 [Trichoderma longibrachiatum ATCC 18648]